jgi:hypothetical protein
MRSAAGLEGLGQLAGDQPQGWPAGGALLDRAWTAVQAGAAHPVVCMSGCARNEVRTLSSSWL